MFLYRVQMRVDGGESQTFYGRAISMDAVMARFKGMIRNRGWTDLNCLLEISAPDGREERRIYRPKNGRWFRVKA